MNNHFLQELFDKIKISNKETVDFNLFSILSIGHLECQTHSRLIGELLNPKGSHAQKERLLELFLNQLGITDFDSKGSIVCVEKSIGGTTGFIDILIQENKLKPKIIIIENKIYSKDGYKQIKKYYEYAKKITPEENISVVYLTLQGDSPSLWSLDNIPIQKVMVISYSTDIVSWVEKSIIEVKGIPRIAESLIQYLHAVKKITGQTTNRNNIMEIKNILKENENFLIINELEDAIVEFKIELQFLFWKTLEKELKNRGYRILEENNLYSFKLIQKYYRNIKAPKGIGISADCKNFAPKEKMIVKFNLDEKLIYGFVLIKNNEILLPKRKYSQWVLTLQNQDKGFKSEDPWIGWKYPEQEINFAQPTGFEYKLIEDKYRTEYISNLLDEFEGFNKLLKAIDF